MKVAENKETIDLTRDLILKYFRPTLLIHYPQISELSFDEWTNLKCIGLIGVGNVRDRLNGKKSIVTEIEEKLKEQYNYDFDKDKNIIVPAVEREPRVGATIYAVFEL